MFFLSSSVRRGFSLIEIAIVLGVIGAVLGGVWVAASAVNNKHRMDDAKKGIEYIVNELKNLPASYLQTDETFIQGWGHMGGVGIGMGILPPSFVVDGRAANPWGDPMHIEYEVATRQFAIKLMSKHLTPQRCRELLPHFAHTLKLSGWNSPASVGWGSGDSIAQLQSACAASYGAGHPYEGGMEIMLFFTAGT